VPGKVVGVGYAGRLPVESGKALKASRRQSLDEERGVYRGPERFFFSKRVFRGRLKMQDLTKTDHK